MFALVAAQARQIRPRIRLHARRMLIVPAVVAVDAAAPGNASVRVAGLVCGVCAARTGAAFARVPGVRSAFADLDSGLVRLECDVDRPPPAHDLQRALDAVVIARPARRLLAWLARGAR